MKRFLKHALFWIAVFVFYLITYARDDDYMAYMKYNVVNVPLYMLAYYLLDYVQIPLLFNQRKYLLFGISFLISTYIIAGTCHVVWFYYWNDSPCMSDSLILTLPQYLAKTIRFYTPAAAILAYKSHKNQIKERERLQELQKEKIETELKYLKAQLNPHFLFNTLNNLYSFVITNSPKAGDMVLRLSEILDYILYKSQAKFVRLEEEIKLIDNYIELEKIRYGDRLNVSFEKENTHFQSQIAPLLLLSIVENAFKHGASGSIDNPKIKINIQENEKGIIFNVWNTKPNIQPEMLNDDYKEGIGLKNIKRQLNLLYPNQHELLTDNKDGFFDLKLIINIP